MESDPISLMILRLWMRSKKERPLLPLFFSGSFQHTPYFYHLKLKNIILILGDAFFFLFVKPYKTTLV
jgi:hypothetical protein